MKQKSREDSPKMRAADGWQSVGGDSGIENCRATAT